MCESATTRATPRPAAKLSDREMRQVRRDQALNTEIGRAKNGPGYTSAVASGVANTAPPPPVDATDEALKEAARARLRDLNLARRSLSTSFITGPAGARNRSVLGGL